MTRPCWTATNWRLTRSFFLAKLEVTCSPICPQVKTTLFVVAQNSKSSFYRFIFEYKLNSQLMPNTSY